MCIWITIPFTSYGLRLLHNMHMHMTHDFVLFRVVLCVILLLCLLPFSNPPRGALLGRGDGRRAKGQSSGQIRRAECLACTGVIRREIDKLINSNFVPRQFNGSVASSPCTACRAGPLTGGSVLGWTGCRVALMCSWLFWSAPVRFRWPLLPSMAPRRCDSVRVAARRRSRKAGTRRTIACCRLCRWSDPGDEPFCMEAAVLHQGSVVDRSIHSQRARTGFANQNQSIALQLMHVLIESRAAGRRKGEVNRGDTRQVLPTPQHDSGVVDGHSFHSGGQPSLRASSTIGSNVPGLRTTVTSANRFDLPFQTVSRNGSMMACISTSIHSHSFLFTVSGTQASSFHNSASYVIFDPNRSKSCVAWVELGGLPSCLWSGAIDPSQAHACRLATSKERSCRAVVTNAKGKRLPNFLMWPYLLTPPTSSFTHRHTHRNRQSDRGGRLRQRRQACSAATEQASVEQQPGQGKRKGRQQGAANMSEAELKAAVEILPVRASRG